MIKKLEKCFPSTNEMKKALESLLDLFIHELQTGGPSLY